MKLLLLLSDEAQIAHRRDAELKETHEEKLEARQKVATLLDELLKRPSKQNDESSSSSTSVSSLLVVGK